jgi:hypothetical protein
MRRRSNSVRNESSFAASSVRRTRVESVQPSHRERAGDALGAAMVMVVVVTCAHAGIDTVDSVAHSMIAA